MRRLGLLLICPFMTGCLAYGCPSLTQTPPITIPDADVHAFRVTKDQEFHGAIIAGSFRNGDVIEEIPITRSQVPAQRDAQFLYYFLAEPFWRAHHKHSVQVKLYRRGFELVEVPSQSRILEFWRTQPISVNWKIAASVEEREKAIDDLNPRIQNSDAIVDFLVSEYMALANEASVDERTSERLREKAEAVRLTGKR